MTFDADTEAENPVFAWSEDILEAALADKKNALIIADQNAA